jgi:hypothetical protein
LAILNAKSAGYLTICIILKHSARNNTKIFVPNENDLSLQSLQKCHLWKCSNVSPIPYSSVTYHQKFEVLFRLSASLTTVFIQPVAWWEIETRENMTQDIKQITSVLKNLNFTMRSWRKLEKYEANNLCSCNRKDLLQNYGNSNSLVLSY